MPIFSFYHPLSVGRLDVYMGEEYELVERQLLTYLSTGRHPIIDELELRLDWERFSDDDRPRFNDQFIERLIKHFMEAESLDNAFPKIKVHFPVQGASWPHDIITYADAYITLAWFQNSKQQTKLNFCLQQQREQQVQILELTIGDF